MYRRPSSRQLAARARKLEAMRRGKEAARLARPASGRPLDLPDLRREVIVIDYDTGLPVTHTLHLHKTRRVDTYRIVARLAQPRPAAAIQARAARAHRLAPIWQAHPAHHPNARR